jgi:FkbM family methyltransferase
MRVRDLIPALQNTPIFYPLRNVYLRTFKRTYWKDRIIGPQRFFRQFVPVGSIVFDIGASAGEYTTAFLSLGAGKVIAVEPTPGVFENVRDNRLTVLGIAVGQMQGRMTFNLSNYSTMNSLSADWLEKVAKNVPGGPAPKWIGRIEVEVSTLDKLIEDYGMPDFIKIDVEGNELEVLRGLTKAPRFLSFEFHSESFEAAISCVQQSCFPPEARFNYIIGEPYGKVKLELAEWCGANLMVRFIKSKLSSGGLYGDILVRCW